MLQRIDTENEKKIRFMIDESHQLIINTNRDPKKEGWTLLPIADSRNKYFCVGNIRNSQTARDKFAKEAGGLGIIDKDSCKKILIEAVNELNKIEIPEIEPHVTDTSMEIPQTSFIYISDKEIAEMVYEIGSGSAFIRCDLTEQKTERLGSINGKVPYNDDLVEKRVILFPTAAEDYESDEKLLKDIQAFIHKYMDVSPFYELLSSYYVMFSWLYDNFNTLPYLRVIGDYGSGKTRFLQTVGSICYKPMFAGGATTPSPVFRIIEMFKGTLILDEADFKASDEWCEIIKILNCGFQAGFPVLRTEEDNGKRSPKAYECYGPKILATRGEFKDKALESRCLTETLVETGRMDIPLLLGLDFDKETQLLRNQLLMFRFRHYGKHKIDFTLQDRTIEKRLNQVILPLYSIIDDKAGRDGIVTFMEQYNKKLIEDRGEMFEALILESIFKILENRLENNLLYEKVYVKTVMDKVNENFKKEEEKMTARKVGYYFRKRLFIEIEKDREGRWIKWNNDRFTKLLKKYGICDDVTFVTIYRRTSDDSHTHQDDGLCDYWGEPPIASSPSSQENSHD